MKKLLLFLGTALAIFAMLFVFAACGGSDDDPETPKTTPTQTDKPNNNNSNNNSTTETGQVQITCPTCSGTRNCPTCKGTGKGCKTCGGSGKYCKDCGTTGNCQKCNGKGECAKCGGTGNGCNICGGTGRCSYCDDGKCKKCYGSGKETCGYCYSSGKCHVCNGLGWTWRSTNTCSICRGSGKCQKCDRGYVNCSRCRGSGNCDECNGTMRCSSCRGNSKCSNCGGNGRCDACKGDKKCPSCKGSPKCNSCGGDGHCSTCNNSDGKCTNCKGEGKIWVDINITPNSLEFTSDGGTQSVSINSKYAWKASCNQNWISLTNSEGTGNGTFTVKADKNPNESSRSATITLNYGNKSTSISVVQKEYVITLETTPSYSMDFTSVGGTQKLSITCNSSWKATSNKTWITLSKSEGEGNDNINVEVDKNSSEDSRSGTITLKSGSKTVTLNVVQKGVQVTLSLNYNELTFHRHGESKTIRVTSDTDWKVSTSASWITLSKTSGYGNDEITVTASDNPGGERSSTITFAHNNTKVTVNVSQYAKINVPFEITNVIVMNTNGGSSSTSIINMEKDGLYASKLKYLSERITFSIKTYGSYKITKKWYYPGSTQPDAYTSYNLTFSYLYDNPFVLSIYNTNWTLSTYKTGTYKWEYYYDDELIYTKTFYVY